MIVGRQDDIADEVECKYEDRDRDGREGGGLEEGEQMDGLDKVMKEGKSIEGGYRRGSMRRRSVRYSKGVYEMRQIDRIEDRRRVRVGE